MKEVFFKNSLKQKLEGDFENNNKSDTIIIICHGFLANKDNKFMEQIFKTINSTKTNVAKINFSGRGKSDGEIGKSTYVSQQDDLKSAISFFKIKGFKKFGIIGHSMGAAVSILVSENNEDIKWLIDIAGPEFPNKIKDRRVKGLVKEAETTGKTIYKSPIGEFIFYKEFFDDLDKVNIKKAIQNIKANLLVIHGTSDESVELEESEELFILAPNPKTFQIISNADHGFRTNESRNAILTTIKNWVIKWVKE